MDQEIQEIEVRPIDNPQVGQRVDRLLCGKFWMSMEITAVDADTISCQVAALKDTKVLCDLPVEVVDAVAGGDMTYVFDRKTGAEIDEMLEWGPPTPDNPNRATGSHIVERSADNPDGISV